MTPDWQVLIVALVALSLQIMTSINMILGRAAVKDCTLWRETDHSQSYRYETSKQFMAWCKGHATIGEIMVPIMNNRHLHQSAERAGLGLLTVLICCSLAAPAQSTVHRGEASAVSSIRATHLLGFENAKHNCGGTLSIHDDLLQFQENGKTGAQVKIGSVRDVILGEESKQVGGLPMTLGKAAAPFGGGRVVSLVAHKKYDTLTLEYVDDYGGIHGAIFQLQKGQAEVVKDQLVAQGVTISSRQRQAPKPSTAEVRYENK